MVILLCLQIHIRAPEDLISTLKCLTLNAKIILVINSTVFLPVASPFLHSIWPPSTPSEPAALKIFIDTACFHCIFWR